MDNKIKAIETHYNGYRFRSRLEARWAVFFDTARIRYTYETEGFVLSNGITYLPDFYLPDYDMHVEVKADTEEGRADVLSKCGSAITWGGPIKQLLILSDIPKGNSPDGGIWCFPLIAWEGNDVVWSWLYFCDNGDGLLAWPQFDVPWPDSRYYCLLKKNAVHSISAVSSEVLRHYFYRPVEITEEQLKKAIREEEELEPLTFAAFQKARQARFEFGEKG